MPDWMIVNVSDAPAFHHERRGSAVRFEDPESPFPGLGINIRVLEPGQPNGLYHSESLQEDFLVLGGECIVIIDDEEHRLRAWDFVHCPPGVEHIFVGAGDGPCTILMVGARSPDGTLLYPRSEVAARYGASAKETTTDPAVAYADWEPVFTPTKLPWPPA